jgi:hypothetical protein
MNATAKTTQPASAQGYGEAGQLNDASPARTSTSQLADEALSARQWTTLLGITAKALHLRKLPVASQRSVRGGLTNFYRFGDLPQDYRDQLEEKRRKFQCLRYADLLDVQTSERWMPEKLLTQMPPATQEKAYKVKSVLDVYFAAIGQGMEVRDANSKTLATWLQTFGSVISIRQLRRLVKRVEDRGGPELARIEAYADGKSVPHDKAQLANKLDVPADFIMSFRAACMKCGMVSAAYRDFDITWKNGEAIPGFGAPKKPGQPFPLTLPQCHTFAPTRAAMIQGSRGKFAAKTSGALVAMVTSSSQLRRCERYVFDDTRINIAALDDVTGDPITLKSYWAMEEASRQIVAFTIVKGRNARQVDVDALTARVLRTGGIAAPGAGYRTTLKYERGTTSCSPARKKFLEGMFPGQIEISITDMIGGKNAPGDFTQDGSGNFFGKGKIESFMRTLDYFCRHIDGQRGGNYQLQPATLGIAGEDREAGALALTHNKGTLADESVILAKAARALAILENRGTDLSPEARLACMAFNIETPLYFETDVREAIAMTIAYYNTFWTNHRMEGFLDVPVPKANGGRSWRKESPNEKARRLEIDLGNIGKSPVRISPADACALLLKAQKVVVKPDGVRITIDGVSHRFWRADSISCYEAQRLATLEKEYVALFDREWPLEIYLLQNTASHYPSRRSFEMEDTAQFLECLPLAEAPQVNDRAAMARHRAQVQEQHNRVAREVAKGIEPLLRERTEQRESNTQKLIRVVTTTGGDLRATNRPSALSDNISEARSRKPGSRKRETPTDEKNFAAYLAGQSTETEQQ